nr:hypothetical protein [Tanacetum cinerariifolium]
MLLNLVVSAANLPILNPNESDLWKMRIEQYFLMTDYSLWEVILNGDSPVLTRLVKGVAEPVAPTTVEQKLARKNELKARATLLMALPDKHQLKFNSHKDASSEGLDQIHDRLQKLVRNKREKDKIRTKPDQIKKKGSVAKPGKIKSSLSGQSEKNRRKRKKNGQKRKHGRKVIKV